MLEEVPCSRVPSREGVSILLWELNHTKGGGSETQMGHGALHPQACSSRHRDGRAVDPTGRRAKDHSQMPSLPSRAEAGSQSHSTSTGVRCFPKGSGHCRGSVERRLCSVVPAKSRAGGHSKASENKAALGLMRSAAPGLFPWYSCQEGAHSVGVAGRAPGA